MVDRGLVAAAAGFAGATAFGAFVSARENIPGEPLGLHPVAFRSTFDWVWAAACQHLGRCRWRPWWPLSGPARARHGRGEYVQPLGPSSSAGLWSSRRLGDGGPARRW
jgi:hypothetical protein